MQRGNSILLVMGKATINIIVCACLAVFILMCLFSCGKRTTRTTHTSIKNDSLQISRSIELTQNATWSDIGSVRPFDNSKPMLMDGKYYYNVVLEFDRSITSGNILKANENLSYTGSEIVAKDKKTEKTDHSNFWIGLSIIIGTLFVLYLTLKKYTP